MLLTANNITCSRASNRIIDNLSFTLHPGELLQITGKNGSGKTTLLRALAGLLPCDEGNVDMRSNVTPFYLGHETGIKNNLTVTENIVLDVCMPRIEKPQLLEALSLLSIHEDAARLCKHLSQGQKQRAALAKMLLSESMIWVLDEPFANLDSGVVSLLQSLFLRKIQRGGGVVVSTHQPITLAGLVSNTIQLK